MLTTDPSGPRAGGVATGPSPVEDQLSKDPLPLVRAHHQVRGRPHPRSPENRSLPQAIGADLLAVVLGHGDIVQVTVNKVEPGRCSLGTDRGVWNAGGVLRPEIHVHRSSALPKTDAVDAVFNRAFTRPSAGSIQINSHASLQVTRLHAVRGKCCVEL